MDDKQADIEVLKLSVDVLTRALNSLVEDCTGMDGKPKAPSHKELSKARGYLPAQYSMSYQFKK